MGWKEFLVAEDTLLFFCENSLADCLLAIAFFLFWKIIAYRQSGIVFSSQQPF
jgi:hypothetical protein